MVFTTKGLFEVAIESWPEWDLYWFFVLLLLLCSSLTNSKKCHSISAELFWVILPFILLQFLYLLRAVKPCLKKVCKDVFYITAILTALNFFSQ